MPPCRLYATNSARDSGAIRRCAPVRQPRGRAILQERETPSGQSETEPGAVGLPAPEAPEPAAPKRLSPAEARAIFVGLMLTVFLAALNQTIVATALPTIGRIFDDFESLPWIVTAYLLTSTAVAPLYGKLSDIHGRRAVILASIGIFTLGSLVCALAPGMLTLVIGRALQGVGGGGILPVAQAVMSDSITPRERGRYQAYMGIVWVTSGIGGPILGGLIAEHVHWSVIFWLNLPLGIAAALVVNARLRHLPRYERQHRLDMLGAVLMMVSAVLLLLALNWGGVRYSWASAPIVALVVGAAVVAVAFGWRLKRAAEPFLPLAVLAHPVMLTGTVANSFSMAASIGLIIFLPLYYELVQHLSASEAGVALIPIALTTPGSIVSGRAMLHMRHYKSSPLVGLTISLVAMAILIWHPAAPLWLVIVVMSIVGFGCGTVFPVCTVSIQNAMAGHQVGTAMGAMNFFRALVSALAVAIMGAILLAGLGTTVQRGGGTAQAVNAILQTGGADIADVFRWVFVAGAVFLAVALVGLLLMEERPLRGPDQAGGGRSAR